MAHIGHFASQSRTSAKPMKLKAGPKNEGSAKLHTRAVKPTSIMNKSTKRGK